MSEFSFRGVHIEVTWDQVFLFIEVQVNGQAVNMDLDQSDGADTVSRNASLARL